MGFIVFASPGGLPQMYPVGSPVTGALESLGINEGLQHIDGMPVDLLPVSGDPPCHFAQQMGREAVDSDPGQNEEPGVVGYKMNVFPARLGRPSDETIPTADVARGR